MLFKRVEDKLRRAGEKLALTQELAVCVNRHRLIEFSVPEEVRKRYKGFIIDSLYFSDNDLEYHEEADIKVKIAEENGENGCSITEKASITWVVYVGGLTVVVNHMNSMTKHGKAIDVFNFPPYMIKEAIK